MNKEFLKEYATLKIKSREIEARLKELAPVIMQEIELAGVDKVPTSLGNFGFMLRKEWKFTEAVELAEINLERLRDHEKATGKATFTEKKILNFREKKDEQGGA